MSRACRVLLLSLLGVLASWRSASAQPAFTQVVATNAGVTVAVPAGLRRAPGLAALPDTPVQVAGLATFTDDAEAPLSVQVRRGDALEGEDLPAARSALAAEWTQRFAAELQVPEAYDFTPGRYDPERGALSLQFKVRGPSQARLIQRAPDNHPLWAPTLQAGEDPRLAKCLLDVVLGGQVSATEAELRTRAPGAAAACGLPDSLVSQYLQQLGPDEFTPTVTTVTYLAFFSRLATFGTFVMAPLERQAAVDEAAAIIWAESEVAAEERLPVASSIDARRLAQLAGILLGSLLGVLLLGGGLSWLLVRLGVRAPLAVGSALGLLCTLALTGCLRTGALQLEGGVQLGSYVLSSVLAFGPLVRWLSAQGGSLLRRARSSRQSRGLSTVEYVVVLVLVLCISLGAWRIFGESVRKALSNSADELGDLGRIALDEGGNSASGANAPLSSQSGPSGDPSSSAGPVARTPGSDGASRAAAGRPAAGHGATGSPAPDAASQQARAASPGNPAQAAASGVLEGMQPGRVIGPAAAAAALPPNAGRVLASAASEPSTLLRGADVATDFIPYLSNVKDATIAATGVNRSRASKSAPWGASQPAYLPSRVPAT